VTTSPPNADPVAADPAPEGYYSVTDLRRRYSQGKTKINQIVAADGFPEAWWFGGIRIWPCHKVWTWEADNLGPRRPSLVVDVPTPPSFPAAGRRGGARRAA
jgi:hypothetical protein